MDKDIDSKTRLARKAAEYKAQLRRAKYNQVRESHKAQQQLGTKIKLAREAAGLNQTELAQKVGVTQQQVSNWESGKHDPNVRHLPNLMETLSLGYVDLYDLLGWDAGAYDAARAFEQRGFDFDFAFKVFQDNPDFWNWFKKIETTLQELQANAGLVSAIEKTGSVAALAREETDQGYGPTTPPPSGFSNLPQWVIEVFGRLKDSPEDLARMQKLVQLWQSKPQQFAALVDSLLAVIEHTPTPEGHAQEKK